MKVGWLHDDPGYVGGAELTMAEFKAAAPDGVTIVDDGPADVVVLGNVTTFSPYLIPTLEGNRVVWYHNDLSPHIDPDLKGWLDRNAEHVFCSPPQRERYGLDGGCVPPPVNLEAFRPPGKVEAPARPELARAGACSIAQWRNPGKGSRYVEEWAAANGPVDVYGPGEFAPQGDNIRYHGPLDQQFVAQVLWAHETFVFLPFEFEPFCRTVAEAHAAGCQVVTNGLIGARHYLEDEPEALEDPAKDFWAVVTGAEVVA